MLLRCLRKTGLHPVARTHTERYLHFDSYHPPHVKTGIIRTLIHRSYVISCDPDSLINRHWSPMHNDPTLSTLFPTPPQLCFRRNPTIADSLVKAALPGAPRPPIGQVPPIPIPSQEIKHLTDVFKSNGYS